MDQKILAFCYRHIVGAFAKLARQGGLFRDRSRESTWEAPE